MSYQDPWLDPMETGEIDPAMMDQAYIDYLVANGAGAGMVPDYQMTGKPLTVQNQIGAVNANRSALFDTAFQGLGGPQAFAPGAFEPTVSTSIKQTPELQQVYGYLRSPQSMEGIMAQEMMTGGTPATAQRALEQMLTATPEEVAAVFAGYDEFFGRQPSVTVDDVERIRTNLLMELPQRPVEYGMPAPDRTIENVNWDADDNSVFARANLVGELQAEIPRVGPSAPQWGVDPNTGQPIQTSAGGELQWGTDETGAPVLMETTVTPSEAAQTFSDLGLPNPAEEYTAESFMTPDQIAMQQAYGEMEEPIAQLKAAWMDPSLAPSNTYVPDRPQPKIPMLPQGQQPGGAPAEALWESSLLDVMGQNPQGPTGGWLNSLKNQGLWDILTGNEGQGATTGLPDQAAQTTATLGGNYLADAMLENPSGDTGGWKNSIMRQGLWDILTGNEGDGGQPPVPGTAEALPVQPDEYAAGSPLSYDQFLTQNGFPTNAAGVPQPQYVSATDQQQNQAQAESRAPNWLSLTPGSVLTGAGGAQAPNPVTIMGQPADQYQAQRAATQAMLQYTLPQVETGEHAAQRQAQRDEDEQNAQVLGGSTNRTGKRVRPTRTGEQARQYRQAFEAWDLATDQQQQAKQQAHNAASGRALGEAWIRQQQGVRPLDQALMARRLVLMNAGMPQGI